MVQQTFSSKIQELKLRVKEMLNERAKRNGINEPAFPTPIWGETTTSYFDYLMNLSDIDFRNIRFHTGLISGESWQYWVPYPEPDPEKEAMSLGYTEAVKDVPESYWIGEPPTPWTPS